MTATNASCMLCRSHLWAIIFGLCSFRVFTTIVFPLVYWLLHSNEQADPKVANKPRSLGIPQP